MTHGFTLAAVFGLGLAGGVFPDVELAHGSIRFSFGRFNTMEDVEYVLEVLPPIIERLRAISTR